MRWLWVLCIAVGLGGCLQSASVLCAGDRVCPEGTRCDTVHQLCVFPQQLEVCVGADPGSPCTISAGHDGTCIDDVCLADACGDRLVTGLEQCDGDNLGGATCETLGAHQAGTLRCTAGCAFDVGDCGPRCGDGMRNGPGAAEECDGTDVPIGDCIDLGFYDHGLVTCTNQCAFNDNACTGFCGDDVRNGNEYCDSADPTDVVCTDFGYDAGRLACSQFCTPGFTGCATIGWRSTSSGTTERLTAVFVRTPSDIYAVGDQGTIRHYNGVSWKAEAAPNPTQLNTVWAASASDVFAAGSSGSLLRRVNGAWTLDVFEPTHNYQGMWGTSATNLYAVGSNGVIVHFNGTAWSMVTSPTTEHLYSIWGSSASDIWAVGFNGTVVHYDGMQWTASSLPTPEVLYGVWGSGPNDIWVVGPSNTAYRRRNNTWSNVALPGGANVIGIYGTGASNIFAVRAIGQMIHFDGDRWSRQPLPSTTFLWGLGGAGPRDVVAVGENGTVLNYGGALWYGLQNGASSSDVFGLSLNDVYSVNNNGGVQHFDGAAWTDVSSTVPVVAIWRAVWGSAAQSFFIGGDTSSIYRGSLGGWTAQPIPAGMAVRSIWGSSATNVFAAVYLIATTESKILRYTGTTWTTQTSPAFPGVVQDIWGSSATDVFVVGDGGKILHYDGTWSTQPSPTSARLTAVWGSSANDVFAVSAAGEIIHYDGSTWSLQPAPLLGAFVAIWGSAPDDVFAAGLEYLLHYDGVRWSPVRLLPSATAAALWGSKGRLGLFGTGPGGIPGVMWLERQTLWHCRSTELSCADTIDDDCDGAIDGADTDC